MSEPRFVVRSVTGRHINPAGYTYSTSYRIPTSYYVLDRAYCHRVAASFDAPSTRGGLVGVHGTDERRRELAEAKAAELNAWDAAL